MKYSFHYLLMANQAIVHRAIFSRLKEHGLTLGQPKVLDYLKDHDGAGQKEMAAGCHVEPASLTSILHGMEEKGLIQRKRKDGNRRSSYVFLTDKGRKMQRLVDQTFWEIERQAFAGIPKEDQEEFLNMFERIYNNLMLEKEEDLRE